MRERDGYADAAAIAAALGGKWHGNGWMAHCPCHPDKTPSLSIGWRGEKVLAHCFAGCSFEDIVNAVGGFDLLRRDQKCAPAAMTRAERAQQAREMRRRAREIWDESGPAERTRVERYLRARGIRIPIPAALRYHHQLWHAPSGTHWPGMIAEVVGADGSFRAIHRTFLSHAEPSKAFVDPAKMSLARIAGGAVRLAPADRTLVIGEGIETTLSVMDALDLPGWAAISCTNMDDIELPESVDEVLIAADGDQAGERAAQRAGLRWSREGRRVRIMYAPAGKDFNDLLMGRTS